MSRSLSEEKLTECRGEEMEEEEEEVIGVRSEGESEGEDEDEVVGKRLQEMRNLSMKRPTRNGDLENGHQAQENKNGNQDQGNEAQENGNQEWQNAASKSSDRECGAESTSDIPSSPTPLSPDSLAGMYGHTVSHECHVTTGCCR